MKITVTFLSYLKSLCRSSIYLQPASSQEVLMLIDTLKQNKASGHDDVLPLFPKLTGDIIALPISLIKIAA